MIEEYCYICEYHAECEQYGEDFVCRDCVHDAVMAAIGRKSD